MTRAFRRPRVLVLEDEPREARVVTRILEDEGFVVDTVYGGEEALGRLAVDHYEPYDLLVLDLRMSGLSGLHVVKFILHHRHELMDRVIITSTDAERDHPQMIGNAAIEIPWIRKPYDPRELVRLATAMVERVETPAPALRSFR